MLLEDTSSQMFQKQGAWQDDKLLGKSEKKHSLNRSSSCTVPASLF